MSSSINGEKRNRSLSQLWHRMIAGMVAQQKIEWFFSHYLNVFKKRVKNVAINVT